MNQNLVGSIHGMSSIKIAHLVPICVQTWLPHAIFVFDWLISKKSSLKLLILSTITVLGLTKEWFVLLLYCLPLLFKV
jgi:hypothetical protein